MQTLSHHYLVINFKMMNFYAVMIIWLMNYMFRLGPLFPTVNFEEIFLSWSRFPAVLWLRGGLNVRVWVIIYTHLFFPKGSTLQWQNDCPENGNRDCLPSPPHFPHLGHTPAVPRTVQSLELWVGGQLFFPQSWRSSRYYYEPNFCPQWGDLHTFLQARLFTYFNVYRAWRSPYTLANTKWVYVMP